MTTRLTSWSKFVCLASVLWVSHATTSLFAQNNSPDPGQIFRQLDVNQDGQITLEEQAGPGGREFVQRLLTMAKKPTTGTISRDELQRIAEQHRQGGRGPQNGAGGPNNPGSNPGTNPGGRPPRSGQEGMDSDRGNGIPAFLRSLDTNSDRAFSKSELQRLLDQFDTLDTNHDGNLDLAELSALASNAPSPTTTNPTEESAPAGSSTGGTAGKNKTESPRSGTAGRATSGRTGSGNTGSAGNRNRSTGTLEGVWRGWVVDGRGQNTDTGHLEMELTISGDRMTAKELGENRRSPGGLGEGTFVTNAQGTSGNLDATQTAGQHTGKFYPGIFELNGDTLKWCVGNRNSVRPTDFETGRGNYLMILRRQK